MPSSVLTYSPFVQAVYDFQGLIAGLLAVAAAIGTASVVWRAARLPLAEQAMRERELRQRQLEFTYATLSAEWKALSARTRQVEGTIKVVIAANAQINDGTRAKCYLRRHQIVDEWTFMSLMPVELFESVVQLYRLIDDHNFDIDRAGGAFGADNFRQSLRDRLHTIQVQTARLAGKADQLLHTVRVPDAMENT